MLKNLINFSPMPKNGLPGEFILNEKTGMAEA
jgi:hypothetical protein